MILAIDFDGTIARGKFPNIGEPQPYAKEAIATLKKEGHYIIINTCRSGSQLIDAINWLLEKDITFDRVNDNAIEMIALHGNNSRKVFADLYIDDRQIGGLPTWLEILDYVRAQTNA